MIFYLTNQIRQVTDMIVKINMNKKLFHDINCFFYRKLILNIYIYNIYILGKKTCAFI